MKFYTIMPFMPQDADAMAEEYIRFSKNTKMTLLLPSMTLHPEGDSPYDKITYFADAYARLKDKLSGSSIKLGILLQTLIGHGWSSANPSKALFQVTINHTGGTRNRICPLDEKFLEYCRCAVSTMAKFSPECFLLDDDMRLLDNDMLECFCPLHLAKFSKKYTREELVELIFEAKPGDAILQEFESIRRGTLENFCRNIRQAIDSVNPSIPCGISGAGREQCMFERMALAAAGPGTEPFVRVGNALYFENSAKDLPRRVWHTAIQIKACGKVKNILDESDTYPHNYYSKSVAGLHSHLTAGILTGLNGSKSWIENFFNPARGCQNSAFEKNMFCNMEFYRKLSEIVPEIHWKGVSSPLPDLEKNFHPKEDASYFDCSEWESVVLGFLGIPSNFRNADDPDAEAFILTGELVDHLTDRDLTSLVKKNLFLDASAAYALKERGYGNLLGAELMDCPQFSGEKDIVADMNMRLLYRPGKVCCGLKPQPECKILSQLFKKPYASAPVSLIVAPGCIQHRTSINTKVVVWAGYLDDYCKMPERKNWLTRILNDLAPSPAVCLNEQDIWFKCGLMSDGKVLAALINLSYDPLESIDLLCDKSISKVEKLTSDGNWSDVAFIRNDNSITVQTGCGPYLPLVLRLAC